MHKSVLWHTTMGRLSWGNACVSCRVNWPFFFHEISFLLEKNNRQVMVIYIGRLAAFSWKFTKSVCHFKENNWQCLMPVINLSTQAKIRKLVICHDEFDSIPVPTVFSDVAVSTNVIFWQCIKKSANIWEMHNMVNQYCPN